ncbi:MAG: AAA family ATPase [Rhodopila sp.]|jgi:predicted ATPase
MGPRLTRITLRGFKTIRNLTDFEPGDLTVLIGPNGAGKTNFISFFRMLSWAMAPPGQLQVYVAQNGNANAFLHDGASVTTQIEAILTLSTEVATNDYGFRLSHAAADTLLFTDEWFVYERRGRFRKRSDLGAGHRESQLMQKEGTAKVILGMLRRIIVHQFHNTSQTARIRNKWDVSDNRWLKEDGANLGAFLYRLETERPPYYNRIQDTLRLILPFFAAFELYPEFGHILLRWREIGSDQVFNVSQASDGMLRAMALVALLQQPEADLPNMLILDEPELGLHPYAIEVLASLIRSASKHVQVIVATQSVSLIDRFDPSDIVVTDRKHRETTFKRLNNDALTEWLETYTLSELWEKNVVGGRPSR